MISKTLYVSYCTCPRKYYLQRYHGEKEVITEYDKYLMSQGNDVGKLARNYFENTFLIEGNDEITKANNTKIALDLNITNIAEASFIYDDLFCAVDLLHKVDNGYEIYEVKSSTSVEEKHIDDVSFQAYVLTKLGYNIVGCYVLYLNNKYIFKDVLELNKYFKIKKIEIKDDVKSNIEKIKNMSIPNRYAITPCKSCGFFNHCYYDIESPNVFELAGYSSSAKRFNEGIIYFKDIIDNNIRINNKQKEQIEFELNNSPRKVNKLEVKDFLDKLVFPLYHLDFETNEDVIPFINGTHPRQKRVIQYSLHIQKEPLGELTHKEYLQTSKYDNLKEVAELLIKDLKDKGSIITYHKAFESGRIQELINVLPEYEIPLTNILNRIVDLEKPFLDRSVYDKKQKGKSSIKKVLPAICKDFEKAYADLPLVHNGTDAMTYFAKMLDAKDKEKDLLIYSLLEYCKLDTLAMVKIVDELYYMIDYNKELFK